MPSPRKNGHTSGLPSVQELTGAERPASRGSVNFSLPTGSRPTSPIGHKRLTSPSPQRANIARIISPTNQNLVYDPNTRSFLPEAELLAIEQRIQDAANRHVKKKKRTPQAAGTHLAGGGSGAKPRGTAIDAMDAATKSSAAPVELPAPVTQPISVPPPVVQPVATPVLPTQSPARKKKTKVVVSDSESDQGSYIPNSSDTDSDVGPPQQALHSRAGHMLAKKPSVVREDREREEREDDTPTRLFPQNGASMVDTSPSSERTTSPSPLPRTVGGRGHGRGQASASAAYAQGLHHTRSASQPAPELPLNGVNGVGLEARNSVRGGRVQSVSPARATHFANAPESLLVKHQPPARSISPRKSALKHSSSISPRGPSPVEGSAGGVQDSETSVASEELSVPKKRTNRVSFDDSHVIVGQAAPLVIESPSISSPQTKRPWSIFGRGKKKDALVDEDDEVMKPRPALPSFGSVRERKPSRELTEERPLVKPAEPSDTSAPPAELKLPLPSPLTSPPIFTSPTGEVIEYPLGLVGQSNDHIIGTILSQDATSKNEANISKSREPLPPQVTSVEGSGYHSESDSSLYDTENNDAVIGRANSVKRGPDDVNADTYRALTSPIHDLDTPVEEKSETLANVQVPEIAVVGATPTLESTDSRREWPDMPGAWGSSTDDSSFNEEDIVPDPISVAELPTTLPPIIIPTDDVTPPKLSPVTAPIMEEPEESDASIYSDAAEDLSDMEGDGFMSLDAMVESPLVKPLAPSLAITTPPDSPTTKATKERAYRKSQLSRQNSEPDLNEGWDKVQAYWSTLSADRKRQIELEARQNDSGSDTEVEVKPAPKPKRKKKVVPTPPPTTDTQQPPPQPRKTVVSPERTYMIQPGTKVGVNGHMPSMRSSMRSEPVNAPGETHIRKSMRGEGSMQGSLRTDAPELKGALQKKHRPVSLPSEVNANPVSTEVRNHIKALSIASAKVAPAAAQKDMNPQMFTLRRRGSGDSDSSFKRTRASSDVPTFRRSMRHSSEQDNRTQSPMQSSRFSLRSLSPTGSGFRRPFNSSNGAPPTSSQNHMRSSMRNSFEVTPTLRNNNSPKTGGFGRSGGSKATKKVPAPRSSRFADSSDEEDDRPTFKSRFNDSSDEEEPAPRSGGMARTMRSAPVRGIPKRSGMDDGDSSDLPDSDDEKPASAGLRLTKKRGQNGSAAATNQGSNLAAGSLRRSGSGRGTIQLPLVPAPTRPTHHRRGSIMSILRRKKPDEGSKIRKSDIESAARRDTPLERSRSDLVAVRADRPPTPKLQKRHTSNSSAWPLPVPESPPKIVSGDDGRPHTADTSDGITGAEANGNTRPDIGTRRFTATGLSGVDIVGANKEGKKKKKFGKLRRMFRLDD